MVTQVHNWLSPLEFKFTLSRCPNVSYSVQQTNIPGINLPPYEMPTPFKRIPVHGSTLNYNDLRVTFLVNEDMDNWFEIYNWMVGLSSTPDFTAHAALRASDDGIYSDGTLSVMNSTKNVNIATTFYNLHPIDLGDIQLMANNPDLVYAQAEATFKYDYYTIAIAT